MRTLAFDLGGELEREGRNLLDALPLSVVPQQPPEHEILWFPPLL